MVTPGPSTISYGTIVYNENCCSRRSNARCKLSLCLCLFFVFFFFITLSVTYFNPSKIILCSDLRQRQKQGKDNFGFREIIVLPCPPPPPFRGQYLRSAWIRWSTSQLATVWYRGVRKWVPTNSSVSDRTGATERLPWGTRSHTHQSLILQSGKSSLITGHCQTPFSSWLLLPNDHCVVIRLQSLCILPALDSQTLTNASWTQCHHFTLSCF